MDRRTKRSSGDAARLECRGRFVHGLLGDRLAGPAFLVCALLSASVAIALLAVIGVETARFFSQVSPLEFFARTEWAPFAETPSFGVLPLLAATAQVAVGALCIAAPLGLLTALYIAHYAGETVARGLNAMMGGLAGVPTVILGYLALNLVTPALRGLWGGVEAFNALSACIAVAAMLLPTVVVLSRDALAARGQTSPGIRGALHPRWTASLCVASCTNSAAIRAAKRLASPAQRPSRCSGEIIHGPLAGVPVPLMEAGLALGAPRGRVVLRVQLPAAGAGMGAAVLMALARAVGETMIVTLAAGNQAQLGWSPLEGLRTLTAYIAQASLGDTATGTLQYGSFFAVSAVLVAVSWGLRGLAGLVVARASRWRHP